jgi:transposase
MFYFGIDWSQDYHHLCILNEAGARVSQLQFEHSLAGFAQVEVERRKLEVPASECLVGIETTYNLVVDFLLEHDYPIYVVPPQATNGYRNRQRSSGAHDDESDATLLASILRTDRASHRRLRPNLALTQQILAEVRLIEILRRSIQRQTNQLRAVLFRTYPQAVGLFSDLTNQIALEFLLAYPTAQDAQTLSREAFEAFLRQHGYTRSDLISLRYAHLVEPFPTANPAIVQAYQGQVRALAQVLLPQVRGRTQAIVRLGQLFEQHPDAFIFNSLPGTGLLLAPALLAKFGDDRDRFPTSVDVQALAGTCPVTERSGKRRLVLFRHGCDKEFRRITQQFARASVPQSGWAAAYWHEIRPHCHSDSHAYRILANRWLAIIWKMWQDRKSYDEAYHLHQRALRRKPRA